MIITSVALMSAAAVSPTFRSRSREASLVMMEVTDCPPTSSTTLVSRANRLQLDDAALPTDFAR
jgi:hypothetical protein